MSDETVLRARKSLSLIFKRLQEVGQNTVAKELSVSDATISGWKTKDAEMAAKVLAELGLKVVPVSLKCYHPDEIGALLKLAKMRLHAMDEPDELQWDE